MKFRKKQDHRVFEPTQFVRNITLHDLERAGGCICLQGNATAHVHTIHAGQVVQLEEGDWIMPEPDGLHFYPIKPDIFEATYAPIHSKMDMPQTADSAFNSVRDHFVSQITELNNNEMEQLLRELVVYFEGFLGQVVEHNSKVQTCAECGGPITTNDPHTACLDAVQSRSVAE